MEVHWIADDQRRAVVERLRHVEGTDCTIAGDVTRYRLAGASFVAVEEPG